MKLSTRSRYGTRMLLDIVLNAHQGPVRIGDIAQRQGVSVKYLEKLIRPLKKGEYIKSRRGPRGGHMLAKDPDRITVGEVVRLLEGELALTDCVTDAASCESAEDCIMRGVWVKTTQAMYDALDEVSFAELAKQAAEGDKGRIANCMRQTAGA